MLQRRKIIQYSLSKFFGWQVNVNQQDLYLTRLPKVLRHLPNSAAWAISVHPFTNATFFTCTCSFSYPYCHLFIFPHYPCFSSLCLHRCQNDITVNIQCSRLLLAFLYFCLHSHIYFPFSSFTVCSPQIYDSR